MADETIEAKCARLEAEVAELREERAATVAMIVPLSLMCAMWRSTVSRSADATSVSLTTPEGQVEWSLGPDDDDLFPLATQGDTIQQGHRERCDRLLLVARNLVSRAEQTKNRREKLPPAGGPPPRDPS